MTEVSVLNSREIDALVMLVNQDRLSRAEDKAVELLARHPNAGILWKLLSVAQVRQGKDALQALHRTTQLLPQDAEAHRNLGTALHAQKQWDHALVSLHRALSLEPDHVESLVDAADALRALKRSREAVPLYQRALQLNPDLMEAHNDLGNAWLELGQYDDAVGCYRRALQIQPDNSQVLCNMANALRQLGFLEAAMKSYQQALILKPSDVDTLNHLGNVLRDLGMRREAVPVFARAIKLEPQRAETHAHLGAGLFELRRIDEAITAYRAALALNPHLVSAHLGLGVALRQQRRSDDAEASCQAALSIEPNDVEALSLLGELRADRGQFSAAEQLFRRAIDINPDFPFAYASVATHRKMTVDDVHWLHGAQRLVAKQLPLGQQISLCYALGKYFDDVRSFDQAFNYYRTANDLSKRYGAAYNRTQLAQKIDRIILRFDATCLREMRPQGCDSQRPVFVVGMPRSGTSLAEQILASHPEVFGAGEVIFWDAADDAYRDARHLPDIARRYLDHLTVLSSAATRVIDKLPANFLYAGLIHAAFPRARIIHMQRHPIDTCLSIYFQNFFNIGPYANDLDDLAHFYGQYLRITNHWRNVLPPAALLEIPYEGLIQDQEGWTRRMVEFVGLPWDPKCLDFDQTERVVITASKWQVRQKISDSSVDRWRHYEKFVGPLRHLHTTGQ